MERNTSNTRLLTGLILTCLTLFMFGISQSLQASASEDNQYINGVSLTDISNPNANGHYGPIDDMQVTYNFDVKTGDIAKNGRDFSVKVPKQFNMKTSFSFDIKDSAGNVVATAQTDTDTSEVKVHWTDIAASKNQSSDIKGAFDFRLTWNLTQIKTGEKTKIDWMLPNGGNVTPNSTDVVVNPAADDNPDEKFTKWAWFDPKDPKMIHWAIRVNRAESHISNAVLNDQIGPNQKLNDGIVGIKVHYNSKDGSDFTGLGKVDASQIVNVTDKGFQINFGDIDNTYLIYYSTEITGAASDKHFSNHAKLTGDDFKSIVLDVNSPEYSGGGDADYHGNGGNGDNGGNGGNGGNDTPDTPSPAPTPDPTPIVPNKGNDGDNNGAKSDHNDSKPAEQPVQPAHPTAKVPSALPKTAKTAQASFAFAGLALLSTAAGLYFTKNKK
ncbi:Ig-like domain-containing protein [Fructobacillus sp. W13]|uniref:Ig-like domain-containing protein n=1 Tax=Fructobacillus apis TaxID=2935017 RepID=A0ABT0ZRJ4_9LACO|nr:collagen binding domain-containing protein [Fructobacillus apis]MCO0832575.1 Ig-like domain-containing protein [Fructobacillus apis]